MTNSDGLPRPQVTAVLESLALQGSSGVLEIDGNPAGAVYLDRGQITFARASWIPDLTARLSGALQPPGAWQNVLQGGDQPERDIGHIILQHRALRPDQLQAIVRSAVVDAIFVLTTPPAAESFVSDIRFQASGTHWAGAYFRAGVASVRAEAATWAQRLAGYRLAPTAPVALRDLHAAPVVLKPGPWAIACRINGVRSAQDLAWECGLPLYETIEGVGELLRAGMCTLSPAGPAGPVIPGATVTPAAGPPVTLPAPRSPEVPPVAPVPPVLPRREPEARADRETLPPPPDLLRRVLDGLRKLG